LARDPVPYEVAIVAWAETFGGAWAAGHWPAIKVHQSHLVTARFIWAAARAESKALLAHW